MKVICNYCDGEANEIEYLDNRKIPVCYKTSCQQKFYEAEQEQKERNRNYDNWRLRSE